MLASSGGSSSNKVKHIIVVGHYGCGGVSAAVGGKRRGLVDHWLHPIREICQEHRFKVSAISDWRDRLNRLCELNLIRQVKNVAFDVLVREAWARGQELYVHGWVYSLSNGLVTDLNVTVSRRRSRKIGRPNPIGVRLCRIAHYPHSDLVP